VFENLLRAPSASSSLRSDAHVLPCTLCFGARSSSNPGLLATVFKHAPKRCGRGKKRTMVLLRQALLKAGDTLTLDVHDLADKLIH
jgi:hypothetical protein